MLKKLDRLAARTEAAINKIGRAFSWVLLFLLAAILVQVLLRYVFQHDKVALTELQWHLYAIAVMVSLSYTQNRDAHVRVDLLHSHFSEKVQRKIEVTAILFLLMPLFAFLFWHGIQFTWEALRVGEKSVAPGGLPWRWTIKAFIPIGAALLLTNSFARIIRLMAEKDA